MEGFKLLLRLTDFVCGHFANSFGSVTDLVELTSAQLCEALRKGETVQFPNEIDATLSESARLTSGSAPRSQARRRRSTRDHDAKRDTESL
ncbi:hypothetical protein K469DRAFT_712337, partial [Zopfia rhizophila CBS 207.26]